MLAHDEWKSESWLPLLNGVNAYARLINNGELWRDEYGDCFTAITTATLVN